VKAADRLATYNAKRDFTRTKEPPGKAGKSKAKALTFVVQKHDATRLHWDFRLELDGVLLSWAVTRGPSRDPKVRRLAVRTEDHPLDYGGFEGTIPKGDYGGGTVMLWDRGTWEPIDEPREGVEKGKFHFRLFGERMKGEWVLIRLKPDNAKQTRENWLLFKIDDEEAKAPDLVETYVDSVASKRSMDAIAKGTASWPTRPRGTAKALPMPGFRPPQLATLVDGPPTGNDWLHETKYDGYRALVAIAGGKAQAYTRAGHDWTEKFARIADAAAILPVQSALIDGEICALDKAGRPGFSALQDALTTGGPLVFFAFDLLELDGQDLAKQPLTDRKAALASLLEAAPPQIVYAEHVRGGGERMFKALCDAGYEGVVSKRADAPYRSGRSKGWLKSKCTKRQEFVIGGWSASGKGRGFASLLLGLNGPDGLTYAGRVGTGFDARNLESLSKRLEALAVKQPPFAGALPAETRGAHWVKPDLVAEIAFAEFTGEGRVRHASFLGLREDKPAAEVKPEVTTKRKRAAKAAPQTATAAAALVATGVTISSPDREVFPELGLTKQALAEYYALLAPAMLEDMAGRPVSLVRCPQGRGKQCFFQKHDSGMFPDSVHTVQITESSGKPEDYLVLDSAEGIVACVQMGTIEFHGWGSRAAHLERPDRLVFDLDPDEGIDFTAVKAAAVLVRDRLQAQGLPSLPMVTGGKGVHVIAPLTPDAEWPKVKDFARGFAEDLAAELPEAFVATMSKAKRKGRIFIDWLRNQRGATAVMPWSVRARDGAPVAVPVSWKTLDGLAAANTHSAADAAAILALASGRRTVKPARLPG
jgi:bifunctional non-homologous end joining protein LigD